MEKSVEKSAMPSRRRRSVKITYTESRPCINWQNFPKPKTAFARLPALVHAYANDGVNPPAHERLVSWL
jgi:hypothetical protein